MTSADFPHHRRGISPGKNAFFPPMPAVSTQRAITFRCSGHHNDVLAHPAHYASYTVPVRQDQTLQFRFLQTCGYPQRPCDLLMVQGVTPAHKGLSPSRLMAYIPVNQRHPCRAHTTVSTRTWPLFAGSKFVSMKKIPSFNYITYPKGQAG